MDIKEINYICSELDFTTEANTQFLRFIPVLSVMLADGHRQVEEINLFYKFVDQFIHEYLYPEVTPMDARQFFAPFLKIPLNKKRKRELAELSDYLVKQFRKEWADEERLNIYNICVEIAAATPCLRNIKGIQSRICHEEQRLLMEMIQSLGLV